MTRFVGHRKTRSRGPDAELHRGIPDPAGTLAEAYARHGDAVYGLAFQFCGAAEAERITVEVFVSLWSTPQGVRLDDATLLDSLLASTHRRTLDVLRSGTRHRSHSVMNDVERESVNRISRQVDEMLSILSSEERQAIVLAYFGGQTIPRIGALLQQPEDAIKGHLRTAMERLQTERATMAATELAQALPHEPTETARDKSDVRSERIHGRFRDALEIRVMVEQAKGIVSEHHRIRVDEAFNLLMDFSRIHNRLLGATCREIIDGSLSPKALMRTTQAVQPLSRRF